MDQTNQNQISDEQAKSMSKPVASSGGMSPETLAFLDLVVSLIEGGKIDLMKPSSLINHEHYAKFDEIVKGKIDLEAVNILASLREIDGLHKTGSSESFQMQNLVERVKYAKERVENENGDIFII